MAEALNNWRKEVETAILPRCEGLPDVVLYKNHMISLVGTYLTPI